MTSLLSMRRLVLVLTAVFLLGQAGIGSAAPAKPTDKPESRPKAEKKVVKLDLNTASESQLQELPGVGEAYAKKIVANRPYTTVKDLAKTGIPKATIAKIVPLVTVKAAAVPPQKRVTKKEPVPPTSGGMAGKRPSAATESAAPATKTAKPAREAAPATPPKKGMVWVNTDSKVYHKEGDRWYGKTLHGQWMTEADAIKEGARLSKE